MNFSPGGFTSNLLDFVVVRRELVQQLLDAVFLPHAVDVGHLVVRQGGEEEVDLGVGGQERCSEGQGVRVLRAGVLGC